MRKSGNEIGFRFVSSRSMILKENEMASEHTAKAFDSDLQELTRLVAEMGGQIGRAHV